MRFALWRSLTAWRCILPFSWMRFALVLVVVPVVRRYSRCRPWSVGRHRSYGSQARWMQSRDARFGRRRPSRNKGVALRHFARGGRRGMLSPVLNAPLGFP